MPPTPRQEANDELPKLSGSALDALSEKAGQGDREALKKLYDEFKNVVYQTALLLLSNRDAAAATTEEVFVTCASEPAPSNTAFDLWLYRTTVRTCIRSMSGEAEEGPARRLSVDEPNRATAIRRRIASGLATLEPNARVAFVLREGQHLDYDRIADVTGASAEEVAHQLAAARARIASVLEGIEFEAWNAG